MPLYLTTDEISKLNKKDSLHASHELRRKDLNLRPSGYERLRLKMLVPQSRIKSATSEYPTITKVTKRIPDSQVAYQFCYRSFVYSLKS